MFVFIQRLCSGFFFLYSSGVERGHSAQQNITLIVVLLQTHHSAHHINQFLLFFFFSVRGNHIVYFVLVMMHTLHLYFTVSTEELLKERFIPDLRLCVL